MPTFSMELPHRCSLEAAHKCVDDTLAELKVRYANFIGDIAIAWQGVAADFTIMLTAPARVDIKGRATVQAKIVILEGEYTLPVMLRAFPVGPMVENGIRKAWNDKCSKCPVEKTPEGNA